MYEIDLRIQTKFMFLQSRLPFDKETKRTHWRKGSIFNNNNKNMLVKSDSQKQKNLITRMK